MNVLINVIKHQKLNSVSIISVILVIYIYIYNFIFIVLFILNFLAASVGTGRRGKPKGYTSIMVQKPKPWGGRRKRRRGRWANREKETHEDFEQEDEMPFMSLDLAKHVSGIEETLDGRPPLSEIDIMIQKGLEKGEKSDEFKTEPPSSNASDDSGSSFNDNRKTKDGGSPNSLNSKQHSSKFSQSSTVTRASKRERDWDTSIESDGTDGESEYVRMQKKQRRPKTRKLDSNPLFWSVDDVFRYLRKTNDCKDIAYRVKQEVMYVKM